MSYSMRSIICNKIVQTLEGFPIGGKGLNPAQFIPAVKLCPKEGPQLEYNFHLKQKGKRRAISMCPHEFVSKFPTDDTVPGAYIHSTNLSVIKLKVCAKECFKQVLNVTCEKPTSFWKSSSLLAPLGGKNIVIEYSSPNIAKPFHMGNLRSTIIGNYVSLINEAVGNKVYRINYLGDWGTQFGLLKWGYDRKNMTESDLSEKAIKKLFDLYVWANSEAKEDPEIFEQAKQIFNQMEKGDESSLSSWNLFRDLSIEEFKKSYKRLNITFDVYHGESMYSLAKCDEILKAMEEKQLLETCPDGRKLYSNIEGDGAPVTVVKSDGSTMYLTRDIAAAIDRFQNLNFDAMIYVVDNSQSSHFKSLFNILKDLGHYWTSKLHHVPFGRLLGMSTRKGEVIFFEEVLDEARDLSLELQQLSKYTSTHEDFDSLKTAEVIGVSSLILANLKRARKRDFTFHWADTLQDRGGSGNYFQYAHCRLVRLEENCGHIYNPDINEELLIEPEALHLLRIIARFDEVVYDSYTALESSYLVAYLLNLVIAINSANKQLVVKHAPKETAEARLKLFRSARHTLHAGLSMLGVVPLNRM